MLLSCGSRQRTWSAIMGHCARGPTGGRGPSREPCQGWEGNGGGGMAGLTSGDCPLGSCSGWLLAPDLAPWPMNQGLVVFHPAGNANEVSSATAATPFTGGVCTNHLGRQHRRCHLILASQRPQLSTPQHVGYLLQLTPAEGTGTPLGAQSSAHSYTPRTHGCRSGPHQVVEDRVLRGVHGASMQQAHQVLIDLAPAAPQLRASAPPRDQPEGTMPPHRESNLPAKIMVRHKV